MYLLTEDLSKDGKAAQSTTWNCAHKPNCTLPYSPNNAVDGNTSTCTRTDWFGGTSTPEKTAWWYVDLGNIRSVYSIRIQYKDYNEYGQQYGNDYCYT
jgi:hypothetical protein